jgi:acyl carrier protein
VLERLLRATTEERRLIVETYLQEVIGRVLRIDPAQLGVQDQLNTLGMDSMMAIELKNRVEQTLSVSPSVVQLLQGATITDLAADLVTQLPQPGVTVDGDLLAETVDALNDDTIAALLDDIEHLTQEEIAQLLAGEFQAQEVA